MANKDSKQGKKSNILLKIVEIILFILILVSGSYFLWNNICKYKDRKFLENFKYGMPVDVNGHSMEVRILGETNNKTVVILPAFGELSPVLQYKPLSEGLADKYRVVTVEPFGYGLSDSVEEERSLTNIAQEIHSCIEKLQFKQYYLLGHSIGGLYGLEIANLYANETLGFIGIDATIPMTKEEFESNQNTAEIDKMIRKLKRENTFGISQFKIGDDTTEYTLIDPSYSYTDDEKKVLKVLARSRFPNDVSINENLKLSDNVASTYNMTFPETVPVLNFISNVTCTITPSWEQGHHDVIKDTTHSEVLKLDGSHYLHHDQKNTIIEKIKAWIN